MAFPGTVDSFVEQLELIIRFDIPHTLSHVTDVTGSRLSCYTLLYFCLFYLYVHAHSIFLYLFNILLYTALYILS